MINLHKILLSVILTIGVVSANYGNIEPSSRSRNLSMVAQQIQYIPLSYYVDGYNLTCMSKTQTIQVDQRKTILLTQQTNIIGTNGYILDIIKIDVLKDSMQMWRNQGQILAGKQGKYSIIKGNFIGNGSTPILQKSIDLTNITQNSTCFGVSMINESCSVIDCQHTENDTIQNDFYTFCNNGTSQPQSFDYNFTTYHTKIKSYSYYSAQYMIYLDKDNPTELTIYKRIKQKITYINTINAKTLNLTSLQIIDFDVDVGILRYIYIIGKIIDNSAVLVKLDIGSKGQVWSIITKQYNDTLNSLTVTPQHTILVAVGQQLIEFDCIQFQQISSYQLPLTSVTSIQANYYMVIITTPTNMLIYQRNKPNLKYLLYTENVNPGNIYLLSPYNNSYTLFQPNSITQVKVDNGHLKIKAPTQTQETLIKVNCTSGNQLIPLNFYLRKVNNANNITIKQNLSNFKLQSNDSIIINLGDYYGGNFLSYSIKSPSKLISLDINHINQYKILQKPQNDSLLSYVVQKNSTLFYYSGTYQIDTEKQSLQMYRCRIYAQRKELQCQQFAYSSQQYHYQAIGGRHTQSGNVVVGYCTSEKIVIMWLTSNTNTNIKTNVNAEWQNCTRFVFNDVFGFAIYKTQNVVRCLALRGNVYFQINSKTINTNGFTMNGFYPKDVIISNKNPNVIYVKLPTQIAIIAIGSKVVNLIGLITVTTQLIQQSQWDFVVGMHSILIGVKQNITEVSLDCSLPNLHTYNMPYRSMTYSAQLDGVYIEDMQGNTITHLLNKLEVDFKYIKLATGSKNNMNVLRSGHWQVSFEEGMAYQQNKQPIITIKSNISENQFKESSVIDFTVQNSETNESSTVQDSITVINYPKIIAATAKTSPTINLPNSYEDYSEIDMDDFYQGCISGYNLTCPACDGYKIRLLTPISKIIGYYQTYYTQDMVEAENFMIQLTNNTLNVLNISNYLSKTNIQITTNDSFNCFRMAFDSNWQLLVFCNVTNYQLLLQYTLNDNNNLVQVDSFQINDITIANANNIIVISDNYTLISDNDVTDANDTKISDVKLLKLNNTTLEYQQTWNSESFKYYSTNLPIHDISVYGPYVLVSLGNLGVGYAKMDQNMNFIYSGYIDFSEIYDIATNIINEGYYQQVKILSVQAHEIQFLITSTASLHMVIQVVQENNKWSFNAVTEKFNRYGQQSILNWQYIDQNVFMQVYYNGSTATFGLYPRQNNTGDIGHFHDSIQLPLNSTAISQNRMAVVVSNILYITIRQTLRIYRIDGNFQINFNYQNMNTEFQQMNIIAYNAYSSAQHQVPVKFIPDNNDDNQGMKWYTIVIIVALILIVIGIGTGIFLKMRAHRKKKKVSLLTQAEDEVV